MNLLPVLTLLLSLLAPGNAPASPTLAVQRVVERAFAHFLDGGAAKPTDDLVRGQPAAEDDSRTYDDDDQDDGLGVPSSVVLGTASADLSLSSASEAIGSESKKDAPVVGTFHRLHPRAPPL